MSGMELITHIAAVTMHFKCFLYSDHLHKAARNDLSFFPKELPSNEIKLVMMISSGSKCFLHPQFSY